LGRSSGKGNSYLTPVFWPGEFHGQRSLVGPSSWGHKIPGTTEQLSLLGNIDFINYARGI